MVIARFNFHENCTYGGKTHIMKSLGYHLRATIGFVLGLTTPRDVQTTMVEKKIHNLGADINAISA